MTIMTKARHSRVTKLDIARAREEILAQPKQVKQTISKCSSYEDCGAPLCPLSEELDDCVWYPDEEICVSRKFASLHWIRIQKRLRKYKVKGDAGYFTRQMLDDTRRCTKMTKGINPDSRKGIKLAGGMELPIDTPYTLTPKLQKALKIAGGAS